MYPHGGMMGWGGYGYGMGLVGWLMMLVFWGLIIAVLVLLLRWLWLQGRPAAKNDKADAPLDILKSRYARGEITKDEFDRIKHDLG